MRRIAVVVVAGLVLSACGSSGDGDSREATTTTSAVPACSPAPDANCRGADLADRDLSGASLVGIDLRNADLSGADLSGADLTQSVLIGANFSGARLDGARLTRATADGADFSGASMRGATLSAASLRGARFDGVETSVVLATGADASGATPEDVVAGLLDDDVKASNRGEPVDAVTAGASAVTPLLEELTFRVSRNRVAPTQAARRYAYTALAMFAAASPGDPLVGSVDGLVVPDPRPDDVHPIVAALVAGSIVARAVFTIPADDATIAEVADGLAARLGADLDPAQLRSTFVYGRDVARAVLKRADSDGFAEAAKVPPPEADEPGEWVPTSPNYQPPIGPGWGTLTPFFAGSRECALPAPARGDDAASPYAEHAAEVEDVAANLTEEQKAIARFWDDSRGRTGTPSGHWLVIATNLVAKEGLDADAALRVIAHTMMTVSDTFVAVWREKYRWMVERPITIIQRSNPDWSSYLVTPAFPEYPSGHSAISRAAAEVLADHLGDVAFDDPGFGVTEQSRRQFNVLPRSFASVREAADEASDSRLYGGIHFTIGLESGKKLGLCVAGAT